MVILRISFSIIIIITLWHHITMILSGSDPLPINFVLDKHPWMSWFPRLRFCGRCRNIEFTITITSYGVVDKRKAKDFKLFSRFVKRSYDLFLLVLSLWRKHSFVEGSYSLVRSENFSTEFLMQCFSAWEIFVRDYPTQRILRARGQQLPHRQYK